MPEEKVVKPEAEIVVDSVEDDAIDVVLGEMAENGLVEEIEPGKFTFTEWGRAHARRLLRNSPEARELLAALEANRERIAEQLGSDEDDQE